MQRIIVLGTGGTIAGTAGSASDDIGYTAGQVPVERLLGDVPVPRGFGLEAEQVAQIDSKDMEADVWHALVARCRHHLARSDVQGLVVTHGTDTLEETAYLLHRVIAPRKPLVLTAAMRPATSAQADGPGNLRDALAVAADGRTEGVVAVVAGAVHAGALLRKLHSHAVDAFGSGATGPLATVRDGVVHWRRSLPLSDTTLSLPASPADWPRVEIVVSHAMARGEVVQALVDSGVRGLVVAATGNGTVHRSLEVALGQAQRAGVAVLRATRCLDGGITARADDVLPSAGGLSPVQARIELMLRLAGKIRRR